MLKDVKALESRQSVKKVYLFYVSIIKGDTIWEIMIIVAKPKESARIYEKVWNRMPKDEKVCKGIKKCG